MSEIFCNGIIFVIDVSLKSFSCFKILKRQTSTNIDDLDILQAYHCT